MLQVLADGGTDQSVVFEIVVSGCIARITSTGLPMTALTSLTISSDISSLRM